MTALKLITLVMLGTAALLPNVPELSDPVAIVFASSWSALMFFWLAHTALKGRIVRSPTGAWAGAFLAVVLLSGLVATLWGTPFALWLRGALPFLFLATVFPFLDLARKDEAFLVNALHIAATVWLLKVLIVAGAAIPAVVGGEVQRLTHATEDWGSLTLPFGLVGLAMTLFNPDPRARRWRWLLAIPFTAMSFLTVHRSQIAIVAAIWLYFVWTRPPRIRTQAAALLLIAATGLGAWLATTGLGESLVARFSLVNEVTESSRALEISYALQQFAESPLLGKGLGYQVPAEVTFAGDWKAILDSGVESVGYIHNLPAYLLMDLGLAGFVAYAGLVLGPLIRVRASSAAGAARVCIRPARIALAAVLLFCLFQPSYRHIQTNLIVAACVAMVVTAGRASAVGTKAQALAGRSRCS